VLGRRLGVVFYQQSAPNGSLSSRISSREGESR
jgi:hypothetical protein